ncbi:hypothetical protein PENTCL1PPCAC_9885, partial [Pristionchus entomophagus]
PSLISLQSHRFRICVLLMLALFHSVAMKVNLNKAIVATVDLRYFREYWNRTSSDYQEIENENSAHDDNGVWGSLRWEPPMQPILFSATFYGSLLTLAFTSRLIQRVGAKAVLAVSTAVSIAATAATPFLSEYSFACLFAARTVMGAAESFVGPSIGRLRPVGLHQTSESR